jgi:hypothetical protein
MQGLFIRDERSRIVPLRFSDSQKILWRPIAPRLDNHDPLWFIVLKGRQVYASTFFEALVFTRTLEHANTHSLVIAQDLDSTTAIFETAKRFYDYLPLPKLTPSKMKELVLPLPGGVSRFKVISAGIASKGRGTTQTCVHASELAFWPHPEVFVGLSQAVPYLPDTIFILESTANGVAGQGELFYKQWKMAVDGRSRFRPIFIPWFIMPKYREDPPVPESEWDEEEKLLVKVFGDLGLDGRSLRWRRNQIATTCEGMIEMFHQEYPSTAEEAFISRGLPAFDHLAILAQQPNIKPPAERLTCHGDQLLEDASGEIQIWKRPQAGHQYAIGVDTGFVYREGKETGDYACAQVLDMDTIEQVAIVHGAIAPWDMSRIINKLGRWYNTAIVNVEVQSTGLAIQDYLLRVHNYPRFHPWRGKPDHFQKANAKLWGWVTNVYSRPLLIEAGRRAINTRLITLHDSSTLDEIKHFSRQDNGKYEAEVGHDDRVLALLLALRTREENHIGAAAARVYTREDGTEAPDHGLSIVSGFDQTGKKRIQTILREKAKKAIANWMQS